MQLIVVLVALVVGGTIIIVIVVVEQVKLVGVGSALVVGDPVSAGIDGGGDGPFATGTAESQYCGSGSATLDDVGICDLLSLWPFGPSRRCWKQEDAPCPSCRYFWGPHVIMLCGKGPSPSSGALSAPPRRTASRSETLCSLPGSSPVPNRQASGEGPESSDRRAEA